MLVDELLGLCDTALAVPYEVHVSHTLEHDGWSWEIEIETLRPPPGCVIISVRAAALGHAVRLAHTSMKGRKT